MFPMLVILPGMLAIALSGSQGPNGFTFLTRPTAHSTTT